MRSRLLAAAAIACAIPAPAQTFVRDIAAMRFFRDSTEYLEPLSGGINAPMQQFHDVDGDGDLDLFIFDSDFYRETLFFRNEGSASAPSFVLEPGGGFSGASFQFWFRFADADGDGMADLLTDDGGTGVRLWSNTGTAHDPLWDVSVPSLDDTTGVPLFAGFGSLPGFGDLDGDGLVDFLSPNSADGSFNYYRNLGSPGSPAWALVSNRLSNITITSDTCSQGPAAARAARPEGAESPKHGVGAVALADLAGSGTMDLYYGDAFAHSMFHLPNVPDSTGPVLQCGGGLFPPDSSLQTIGLNQASFSDIDGDGDPDLFVGVLNSRTRDSFWQYRNDGAPGIPDFHFVTTDYLNTLDAGQNARPALADLDGDLDLDLVVGNNEGRLWSFINEGNVLVPIYRLADTAFAGITGNFSYSPAFADFDGDGDPDLVLGRFDGRVIRYRNDGGAFSPVETLSVAQYAVPAAGDVDGDGDLDLVVGKGNGTLAFYRNAGTPAAPAFIHESDGYLSVDVGDMARPAFRFDPDSGRTDLFVAGASGIAGARPRLRHYRNTGAGEPPYVMEDSAYGPDLPYEPAALFGDPDGDGDDDLLVGTSKGGLVYYRFDGPTAVEDGGDAAPAGFRLGQNYPNPFNAATVIPFDLGTPAEVTAEVFDVSGRRVARIEGGRRAPGPGRLEWNAGALGSGVYYYRVSAGGRSLAKSMTLLK